MKVGLALPCARAFAVPCSRAHRNACIHVITRALTAIFALLFQPARSRIVAFAFASSRLSCSPPSLHARIRLFTLASVWPQEEAVERLDASTKKILFENRSADILSYACFSLLASALRRPMRCGRHSESETR
eukprot:1730040-Pleurochrysis_carterae.AAC.2